MWDILAWIIVGVAAGWIASLVVAGGSMGVMMDMMVGLIGATLGGALLSFVAPTSFTFHGFNVISVVIAFFGATLLLLVARALNSPRSRLT